MALDTLLIGILACPIDKGTLLYFEDDDILYNPRTKTAYDRQRWHPGPSSRHRARRRRQRGQAVDGQEGLCC